MTKFTQRQARKWSDNTVGHSSKDNISARLAAHDGYHTPRIAVKELLRREDFSRRIWEPANGYHRISRVLERAGHRVYTSDIKLWCKRTQQRQDFLRFRRMPTTRPCDIITNPPFSLGQQFVEQSMRLLPVGGKLALLLRLQFMEGIKRKLLIYDKTPPVRIWVFSYRLPRMHRFGHKGKKSTSVLCFSWFVWIKGYKGPTEIKWI
jgi:hypothetical protein